jgi:hypothetical protein
MNLHLIRAPLVTELGWEEKLVGRKQILGLAGSVALFIGVFTPIVSLPVVGNMNYFQNGRGDGVIVLVLAVVSLILVLIKRYRWLWLRLFLGIRI